MSITRYQFTTKNEVDAKRKELATSLVYIFGSEQCGPCRRLSDDLGKYNTDAKINIFELKIPHFVDMHLFKDTFKITTFPKIVIVDKEENIIAETSGYANINLFGKFLDKYKEMF